MQPPCQRCTASSRKVPPGARTRCPLFRRLCAHLEMDHRLRICSESMDTAANRPDCELCRNDGGYLIWCDERCRGGVAAPRIAGATLVGERRAMPTPVNIAPTSITADQQSRMLEVGFDDGALFRIPFELMRVYSPSAEVQGHGPGQEVLQTGKRG